MFFFPIGLCYFSTEYVLSGKDAPVDWLIDSCRSLIGGFIGWGMSSNSSSNRELYVVVNNKYNEED